MKCATCGKSLMRVVCGNLVDWVLHPTGCQDMPKQPEAGVVLNSWEPAARHYRDIEVA